MREITVEDIFSTPYAEHNDSIKDGVYKQESLYIRNKQANVILHHSHPCTLKWTNIGTMVHKNEKNRHINPSSEKR